MCRCVKVRYCFKHAAAHTCACCLLQSVSEARLLLRDWLVIFTANYHRNSFMRASATQLLQLPVSIACMTHTSI
jgi:hypothetical protein